MPLVLPYDNIQQENNMSYLRGQAFGPTARISRPIVEYPSYEPWVITYMDRPMVSRDFVGNSPPQVQFQQGL